jgi:ribosomal protein L29
MKKNKTKLITKKKITSLDSITRLRQALFILRLEQSAGRLLKTHQIKKIKKEIARLLTKQNQPKAIGKNEPEGGEI